MPPFRSRPALAVIVLLTLVAFAPGTAAAQEGEDCGVYGCVDGGQEVPAPPPPSCTVTPAAAAAGSEATAHVTNVPAGRTVELKLNGQTVASGTAGAGAATTDGSPPVAVVDLPFVVPSTSGGDHQLVAVAPAFQVNCPADEPPFTVLPAEFEAPTTPAQTPRSGALPRTGTAIGLLLVLAVGFIVIGRRALTDARRRRAADAILPRVPYRDRTGVAR